MRTNVMAALAAIGALSWSGVSRAADSAGSGADVMEGTVVKADKHVLLLKMHGAVIPVHVTARTHFEGGRDQLKQFAPGEQVRVSLRDDSQTLNEARSVGLSDNAQEGVGGSGFTPDAAPPRTVEPTHATQMPLQPGVNAGSPNEGVMNGKTVNAPVGAGTPSGMLGQPQSASVPRRGGTPSGMMGQPQSATGAGAPQP